MSYNLPEPPSPLEDEERWWSLLEGRFGLRQDMLPGFMLYAPNQRSLSLISKDHALPTAPPPLSAGLPFLRTNMKFPKMTTGATLAVGHLATRNVVNATRDQVDNYFRRQPFTPTPEQCEALDGVGYVIVRHEGVTAGLGLYLVEEEPKVASMFPKSLANGPERSAFLNGQPEESNTEEP